MLWCECSSRRAPSNQAASSLFQGLWPAPLRRHLAAWVCAAEKLHLRALKHTLVNARKSIKPVVPGEKPKEPSGSCWREPSGCAAFNSGRRPFHDTPTPRLPQLSNPP